MSAIEVFAGGMAGTLVLEVAVFAYLRRPLKTILVELCGSEARAGFWTAFSATALGLVPVIFAIACRPAPGPGFPPAFELAEQLKWGMIGLMISVLFLGWMIGRSIIRWETRAKAKS